MNHPTENFILADARWYGPCGIGRFAFEILNQLNHTDLLTHGPHPLSFKNLFWQSYLLSKKSSYKIFFTPGFNPQLKSPIPFVFTIHDLIHLHFPGKGAWQKKIFYDLFIKKGLKTAYKIITVSDYSKQEILNWANIPAEKIVVVNNGVSKVFTAEGLRYQPGFPYLLHVGNTKEHKNIARLIKAFACAKIDQNIRLIFISKITEDLAKLIQENKLTSRIIFSSTLSEQELAALYRGAMGLTFPSLYEGFGLPVVEAMACGIPVLTSNTSALPEVASDAALLIDPFDVEAISHGIEQLVNDSQLRKNLIAKGFNRVQFFSWIKTMQKIQSVLNID